MANQWQARALAGLLQLLPLALLPGLASAQAGPPMITNDPDTPGPGAWEINLATTGSDGDGEWQLDSPDIDINRGVGERVQLSLHTAWAHQHDTGGAWASGEGPVELGMRWRILDQEQIGVAVAVQPMWISSFSHAAQRQGLASPDDEFVLPLQIARHFDHSAAGIEIVRHWVEHAGGSWQAGVFGEYDCAAALECLAEVNTTWSAGEATQTIFNLGARKSINPHLNLIGSFGRQIHASSAQTVFYLGVQLLRD